VRISSIAVLVGIVISSAVPALAFYPSGTINRDLTYDNIRIIQRPRHLRVTGTLTNQTSRRIKVNGVIRFCTIHKEVLNSATIKAMLPPNGSIEFDRRLANDDYQQIQHAYTIEWDIQDDYRAAKHRRAHTYRRLEKSAGYGSTRISDSSVQVFGSGDHNSDPFELKAGFYITKVSHNGKHRCAIKLLHGDGTPPEIITDEIGYIVESKLIRVERDGNYRFSVSADGDWTVSMACQEPKAALKEESPDQNAAAKMSADEGSAGSIVIRLKNGHTIKADSCWEVGGKVHVSIYGGIMIVDQTDVREIIRSEASKPQK
jgi:hypothetical protein